MFYLISWEKVCKIRVFMKDEFYKKCLKAIKNTRKRAFSGVKYPTQWDDEAKFSEKTKVFKAFLV
mgnify:CR=1 FL=1